MKVFENKLPVELCKRICDFALQQLLQVDPQKEPVRMWSNFGWPQHIVKDSTAVFIFVTPSEFLYDIQNCLEKFAIYDPARDYPLLNKNEPDLQSICLIYVWTPNSYIPLHKDGKHRKTVTIYCNEDWSFEKGGTLQWFEPESNVWRNLVPSCGTIVLNDSDYLHATTPVKTQNEFRISIQVFFLSSLEQTGEYR